MAVGHLGGQPDETLLQFDRGIDSVIGVVGADLRHAPARP